MNTVPIFITASIVLLVLKITGLVSISLFVVSLPVLFLVVVIILISLTDCIRGVV